MTAAPRPKRTADVARAVGVHPNTVRLYEAWGFLPSIPRAANGYRCFTEAHINQMRLARTAMRCTWVGGHIRRETLALVQQAAAGDLTGARHTAHTLQTLIHEEQMQAEAAVVVLENWAQTARETALAAPLRIGQAAKHLGITIDMLRNWERNGLITVPRSSQDGYRAYGSREISRLRVIRTLSRARYSTMAILRMLHALDSGQTLNLRQVLDTPRPDEDVFYATDHWLSALAEISRHAADMVAQIETMIGQQSAEL